MSISFETNLINTLLFIGVFVLLLNFWLRLEFFDYKQSKLYILLMAALFLLVGASGLIRYPYAPLAAIFLAYLFCFPLRILLYTIVD